MLIIVANTKLVIMLSLRRLLLNHLNSSLKVPVNYLIEEKSVQTKIIMY